MKTIELTQGQVALVDDIDYEYLSQWKWQASIQSEGYWRATRKIHIDGKQYTVFMHQTVAEQMGFDFKLIDHRDRDPLNNTRENLRAATKSQNGHNRSTQANNKTTLVKGVYLDKRRDTYYVQIKVGIKRFCHSGFKIIPEAAAAIQKLRQELVGEFACN